MRLTASRGRVKNEEIVVHVFIHLHDTRLVGAPVAVVRG
jgi:hypothetical protein